MRTAGVTNRLLGDPCFQSSHSRYRLPCLPWDASSKSIGFQGATVRGRPSAGSSIVTQFKRSRRVSTRARAVELIANEGDRTVFTGDARDRLWRRSPTAVALFDAGANIGQFLWPD